MIEYPLKKFEKQFDLYRNYSFPDRSNSAKIYVVRYSSKNFKFDVYCKYTTQSEIFELDGYNYRSQVLDIVHLRKYSNSMAIIIELNKKLR